MNQDLAGGLTDATPDDVGLRLGGAGNGEDGSLYEGRVRERCGRCRPNRAAVRARPEPFGRFDLESATPIPLRRLGTTRAYHVLRWLGGATVSGPATAALSLERTRTASASGRSIRCRIRKWSLLVVFRPEPAHSPSSIRATHPSSLLPALPPGIDASLS